MNIIERSDEEIRALADPLWRDLLKHSNEAKYGEFVARFARSFALAMNQVAANHQFADGDPFQVPTVRVRDVYSPTPVRWCR